MDTLLERFLRYLTFHTRSDATNSVCPSSEGQLIFARALQGEMQQMGLTQVTLDEHGYLTACLPGNQPDAPAIAQRQLHAGQFPGRLHGSQGAHRALGAVLRDAGGDGGLDATGQKHLHASRTAVARRP